MAFTITQIGVHLICFAISFYALSCVKFDRICDVAKPAKVQLLLFVSAAALGYLCAQFLLALTIYNGL